MRTESVTRRGLLAALAGVTLGGLTGCSPLRGQDANSPRQPHPLAEHVENTTKLAQAYEAAFAAHPDLAATYGVIRDNHWAHAEALATATRQPPPSRTPTGGPVPDGKAALARAEREAARAAYEATLTLPGTYTALLGSIAACRATHVQALS